MAAYVPVEGTAFVNAVRALATLYRLDPLAVFASAVDLGIDGIISYSGTRYGPWELSGAAGPLAKITELQPYDADGNDWAWSNAGLTYAVTGMANAGARGLTGHAAVDHIVKYFERPADLANQTATREATYDDLVDRGAAVWGYLAGLAGGPSTFKTPAPPTVAQIAARKASYANQGWRDLAFAFSRTTVNAGTTISNVARRIPKAVK